MQIFGITPDIKRENRQYWGRELGMVWQKIIIEVFKHNHSLFKPAEKVGLDEPYDLQVGNDVIDAKYRVGSGDSGTLKKFKTYGKDLKNSGLNPIVLILREDNLPAAITACNAGGWTVLTGDSSFQYIEKNTGVDLKALLKSYTSSFNICR